MTRVQMNHRILACHSQETEFPSEPAINLSDDTVFQFLNDEYPGLSPASSVDDDIIEGDEDERERDNENENENENESRPILDNNFWENQQALLQSTLCRTTSLESKIRSITKEALKDAQVAGDVCACGRSAGNGCRKCLMEIVCRRLQNEGFNGAICKSKWRSSPDMPSGEHTFLDVIDNKNPKKETRVIIELNFRAEFEMARSGEQYHGLIKRLPELFVGKIERLMGLLKILCGAAKKCMKEKKMHLGPWRRHGYMRAKWARVQERLAAAQPFPVSEYLGRPARPRMSMLTADLSENVSSLHRPAVAVV